MIKSCQICSNSMKHAFFAKVLGKYQAEYEVCNNCGYLRIKDPYWLKEAYSNAIANADTGIVMRSVTLSNKISRILFWLINHKNAHRYLDAAGGYGILTRMMRDNGFDFYWADKFCENLVVRGFEFSKSFAPCSAVTAIEVLEHVTNPFTFIKEVLEFSGSNTFIFTTELYEGEPPEPKDWAYYSFLTGQHIGFFQHKTLSTIARKLDLNFVSANGIHIFSKVKINKFILKLITNRYFSLFPPFLIRRTLGSKTLIDNKEFMKKIKNLDG